MEYEGMVYRPPSEAYSLIFQVTVGCSHNKCAFCSMFKDDSFHVRRPEAVYRDMVEMRHRYSLVRRIFLADGDALCLSTEKLLLILSWIEELFPECERVGIYGSAKDILRKSPKELKALRAAGIGIVYIGAESGSPEVLKNIKKNATREELIESVRMAERSGILSSVTFISGLGGRELSTEHAISSASMLSAMNPSYASLLTLMLEPPAPMYYDLIEGRFHPLSRSEVLGETELFLKETDIKGPCVFRSNHASNYLSLAGDLPKDKEKLLSKIDAAKKNPALLRSDAWRAL